MEEVRRTRRVEGKWSEARVRRVGRIEGVERVGRVE